MVKKMNMNKTIMKMVSKMMQYFLTTNKSLKTLKITVNSNNNNNNNNSSKRKKNKNNDNETTTTTSFICMTINTYSVAKAFVN